jgi:hypothetical protein
MKTLDTLLVFNQGGWDYGFIKSGQRIVIGNCLKLEDATRRLNYLLAKDSKWLDIYTDDF